MRTTAERLAAIVAILGILGIAAQGSGQDLAVERIASGLIRPVYVTSPPGETQRLFVVEPFAPAQIRILDLETGEVAPTPFLRLVGDLGLDGLLGLAFHPDYARNGRFFVHYGVAVRGVPVVKGRSVLAEYRVREDDPTQADPASERILLQFDQPGLSHNGGWIGFGRDGYLYFASGDGGDFCDAGAGHTLGIGNAQDLSNLLGKILRIDVDGDDFPQDALRNYAIPPDNPFVGQVGAAPEIFTHGFRNPWRASFDRETGDLYIGDVGEQTFEEVNLVPGTSGGGQNFGWRLREGTIATPDCDSRPIGGPRPPGAIEPIHQIDHASAPDDARSMIGGYVYRGPLESLRGLYFFADFTTKQIGTFRFDGSSPEAFDGNNVIELTDRTDELQPDTGVVDFPVSFGEDGAGNLYLVDLGVLGGVTGEVFRIVERRTGCSARPRAACLGGNTSRLRLRQRSRGGELTWSLMEGEPARTDPKGESELHFCLYEQRGPTAPPSLALEAEASAATTGTTRNGLRLSRPEASEGLTSLLVTAGSGNRIRIELSARSDTLPALPLAAPGQFTAQLQGSGDSCWGARFDTRAERNDVREFRATVPVVRAPLRERIRGSRVRVPSRRRSEAR